MTHVDQSINQANRAKSSLNIATHRDTPTMSSHVVRTDAIIRERCGDQTAKTNPMDLYMITQSTQSIEMPRDETPS